MMLEWAERQLAVPDAEHHTLTTFCLAGDEVRVGLLQRRGYAIQPTGSVQRWRSLTAHLPTINAKEHDEIRSVNPADLADIDRLTSLINVAFGHDFTPGSLQMFTTSPSYDADLQIVAERDGEFVSHAGVTIDAASKLAIVEPVCTHPDWVGQGLATAVTAEGLRRAAEFGATRAVVGTGLANTSNHVYAKLGFDHIEAVQTWQKAWPLQPAQ